MFEKLKNTYDILNRLDQQNAKIFVSANLNDLNIILDSDKSKSEICATIKEGIKDKFGYDVPVIIRTISEWKKAIG